MHLSAKALKTINLSYLLLSVFVFGYVLLRAMISDITYDEVWTIFDFIPNSYFHILNFTPPDTNNHILNSISIKFLYSFLPDTVFVARIPNVIALLFYLFFAVKLCKKFLGGWKGLLLFVALTLNPYALDYFGLARGYGMMLGMQMAALYHVFKYFETKQNKHLFYLSLFSLLMILANFSSLYFYLGWLGVFFISLWKDREYVFTRTAIVMLFTILITVIIWEPIRKLIEINGFYVGGTTGFYEDTIWSLVRYSIYEMERSDWNQLLSSALFTASVVCVLLAFFGEGHKNRFWLSLGILSITALATIVQHYVLKGFYLIDRTALFFYPVMILTLFFAIDRFDMSRLSMTLSLLIAFLILLNFVLNANTYKSLNWYFDAHTEEMLSYINKVGEKEKRKQKIDYSWPFESSLAYYMKSGKYPFIENARKSYFEVNDSCDFYIYLGGKLDVIPYAPEKQLILNDARRKDKIFEFKKDRVVLFGMETGARIINPR
ncbi:MAG: hypothetical protein JNL60_00635 [Bacteroidia bacterium]|nr:hypothetical protein [Bacteroidia bacterium]